MKRVHKQLQNQKADQPSDKQNPRRGMHEFAGSGNSTERHDQRRGNAQPDERPHETNASVDQFSRTDLQSELCFTADAGKTNRLLASRDDDGQAEAADFGPLGRGGTTTPSWLLGCQLSR